MAKQPPSATNPAVPPIDLAAATLADVRKSNRSGTRRKSAGKGRKNPNRGGATMSGPGPDGRDPQTVGSGVTDLLADRGWQNQTKVASVVGRWRDIAGEDLAEHVDPETFDEASGLLRLKAESTTWATQVRLLIPQLLRRLDAEIGAGIVRSIEVTGPVAPKRGYGQLRVPGRGPRDTYG